MPRRKNPQQHVVKRDRRKVLKSLRNLSDRRTRNVVRGVLAKDIYSDASSVGLNLVRKSAHPNDLALATELLLGRDGAFPFKNTQGTQRSLMMSHNLAPIDVQSELTFVIGHLNGWKDEVRKILGAMATLAPLARAEPADAMTALGAFAHSWGASNYLTKKVAFLMSSAKSARTPELNAAFSVISDTVKQSRYPGAHFVSLEMIDVEFPYFSAINTRYQASKKHIIDGDFRQHLHLHNVLPCPHSLEDIGPFLRKAHAMSLVDEVVALLQLRYLQDQWPLVGRTIERWADGDLLSAINMLDHSNFQPVDLFHDCDPSDADFAYYRRSLAFLEFAAPTRYRHFVDRVLAPRMLPELIRSFDLGDYPTPARRDLTKALTGFRQATDYLNYQSTGEFLRTFHFLLFVSNTAGSFGFDSHDLRFILEHTQELDKLLFADEIERLYSFADEGSRPLVTVLALALFKSKAADEDVDFKFRFSLCMTVISQFNGNIERFIEWLLPSTPRIAMFLLHTLDRLTLQKLYWVISSADQADTVRQAILRAVGKHTKQIEYFIEADAIEAQRQISKLRQYFDDSRMYVDGIAMKKWIVENSTSYTHEYSRAIEHHFSSMQANAVVIGQDGSVKKAIAQIEAPQAFDYMLKEVTKSAFEQFCVNVDFGIESYLGRRIRHNTLTGMMMGGVDTLIDRHIFEALRFDERFMQANADWLESYSMLLKHLRLDVLQFKSKNPRGMFSSELDFDNKSTYVNLVQLRNLAFAGRSAEVFYDLLIRFCWSEIQPQLAAASKAITVDLLNRAKSSIDSHLGAFSGDTAGRYRSLLWDAVHERFTRLGSWFRQPESGFVSASTRQLGDLVAMEASNHALLSGQKLLWSGDGVDVVLDGLSVHRLYDCLSVLIRNAFEYGEPGADVAVDVNIVGRGVGSIGRLTVTVVSALPNEKRQSHVSRLQASFAATDLDTSMAKEGYSGIKKLRFITGSSESRSTASYRVHGDECEITFVLTVEFAAMDTRQ